MNYNFEYNSPVIGKIQPFEYSYATTNEYAFTYDRDIFSDLSKYNAPIFVARKRRGFFSYKKNMFATRVSNYRLDVNRTEKNVVTSFETTSLYEQKTITKNVVNLNVLNDNLYANKELHLEVFKDFLLQEHRANLDYQTGFFLNDYTPKKVILTNLIPSKKDFALEIYDNYFLEEPVNSLSVLKEYLVEQKNKKQTSIKGDMFFHKRLQMSIYKEFSVKEKYKQKLYIDKEYMLFHDKNQIFLDKEIGCTKPNNNMSIYESVAGKRKYHDSISIYQTVAAKSLMQKQVQQINPIIFGSLSSKRCVITDKLFYCKLESGNASYHNKLLKLAKYKKRLLKSTDIVLGYHPKRKVCFRKENLFVYKYDKNLFLTTNVHLSKKGIGFAVNNTETIIKKGASEFDINASNIYLKKQRKGFVIDEVQALLDKKKIGFVIEGSNISLYKDRHGFRIHNDIAINNIANNFVIDDSSASIYKDRYLSSVYITEANLSDIDVPVTMEIHSNTIGFIVSANAAYKNDSFTIFKEKNYLFKNDTADFINKEKHNSIYNQYSLFTFTKEKEAFLDYYHPLMMTENLKNTLLFATEELITKRTKDAIIYDSNFNTTKSFKDAFISLDTSLFISAGMKKITPFEDAIFFTKKNKQSFLSDTDYFIDKGLKYSAVNHIDTWVHKNYQHSRMFSREQLINKQMYEAFIYDNDIVIDKLRKGIYDNNINTFIERERKGFRINDIQTQMTKERNGFEVNEEYLFITRDRYEMNPFVSQLTAMKKIIKELEKPVEKVYNWAYVYQYEDPIDPNYDSYGIDELLLPKKDVNYEAFEDAIFDKKSMKPKKPIKIIDNSTFIAKYPIKHPITNYEEIGIEYVDVPAELMQKIFIKFYQIWYANIFKFGNMSMVDSLKLMLEYMYAHIITTYSGSDSLEPALRVFRQIRWFGETSVMHNAQYKITCEYEDLKSDLQTGSCNIKNVLNGFEVDKKLKVLSSTPTTFGSEAYIKLYTENQDDTQISFSISFIGGQVEILLNGELIDIITSNRANILYELPATDDVNEFIIRRTASSNIGYCYVGNIIIKNGAYKNLNIDYDPDLKAGNMPLNDVVNKMVILANMYDNEQEIFEQFRKGNLAVSELYKKLETYWELHHANKAKGKRLTIKET